MRLPLASGLGQKRSWNHSWCLCCLVVSFLTFTGCAERTEGPEREAVSGTVTREGIPVDLGTIMFQPNGGGPAASTAIIDGKYKFDKLNGPVSGTQKVEIVQFPRRGAGAPGTPKKDLPILPETRFKGTMPKNGWVKEAEVASGHDSPLDFKIE